jgi:exosortase/archaeosortase family protein
MISLRRTLPVPRMSVAAVAMVYGYLYASRTWVRVLLAFASLPVAVGISSLRVRLAALLAHYWHPEPAQKFFHESKPWFMFLASLAMLYLLHQTLRLFWPEKGVA